MSYVMNSHSDKYTGEHLRLVVVDWLSDASGDAEEVIAETPEIVGYVSRVVTVPSAESGLVPTASYDIVLNDAQGVDVLSAAGADRSATAVEDIEPDPPVIVVGDLTLVVSNSGDITAGTVYIYVT
jgi:hypothetical protein